MPADTIDALFAGLKRDHDGTNGGCMTLINGGDCDCDKRATDSAVDSARAHVAALLADKDAVIARMGEALRHVLACVEYEGPPLDRPLIVVNVLEDALAPDAVSRAIEEHRAMVLDAGRMIAEVDALATVPLDAALVAYRAAKGTP